MTETTGAHPWQVAVLDDYQQVALSMADWTVSDGLADVTVFSDHVADPDQLVARLARFDVVCVMRERTPLPRSVLERLPRLRLICSTAHRNRSIDLDAAAEHGIEVRHTGYDEGSTVELTWALILASARNIVTEVDALRSGGWQETVGAGLAGRTLGVLGLGNIGSRVARIGRAFGMEVIAWSQNLTAERAAKELVERVDKDELFQRSDVLTIHLVLSERTRGLVSARELALMKPTARLVNTSRGPIVDERDLLDALGSGTIAGAALDVFDTEPLPRAHPLRSAPRLLATPHIGYVSDGLYRTFYQDTVENIRRWIGEQGVARGAS
jgi:phosphoglycerate dehydrogenase-like enzyme